MSPQLETVLEISAFGTTFLFAALVGLIGLMYLLTTQRLFNPVKRPEESASQVQGATILKHERQLRAIALAVAVAHATKSRRSPLLQATTSDWRRLHHTRRLSQHTRRMRARS